MWGAGHGEFGDSDAAVFLAAVGQIGREATGEPPPPQQPPRPQPVAAERVEQGANDGHNGGAHGDGEHPEGGEEQCMSVAQKSWAWPAGHG